ncbi:MAG: DUF11 domain-containing protein, partial [Thermoleophilia bacterium]
VTAQPGQTLTYTITVRNVGNQDATGVTVIEKLQSYVSFVIGHAGNAGWIDAGNGEYSYKVGNLAAGDSIQLTFVVMIADNLPVGLTKILNIVTVSDDGSNGFEANMDDNRFEDTDEVTVNPEPAPLTPEVIPAPIVFRALPVTGFYGAYWLAIALMMLFAGSLVLRGVGRAAKKKVRY